jgi:hypothetical protein
MADIQAETIYGCFEETAERFPERVALVSIWMREFAMLL